jgi:hypothetical protein
MADVAITRLQLVDNGRIRDSDRKRIHKIMPWQMVVLAEGPTFWEPVDYVSNPVPTIKEITGLMFVDETIHRNQNGHG